MRLSADGVAFVRGMVGAGEGGDEGGEDVEVVIGDKQVWRERRGAKGFNPVRTGKDGVWFGGSILSALEMETQESRAVYVMHTLSTRGFCGSARMLRMALLLRGGDGLGNSDPRMVRDDLLIVLGGYEETIHLWTSAGEQGRMEAEAAAAALVVSIGIRMESGTVLDGVVEDVAKDGMLNAVRLVIRMWMCGNVSAYHRTRGNVLHSLVASAAAVVSSSPQVEVGYETDVVRVVADLVSRICSIYPLGIADELYQALFGLRRGEDGLLPLQLAEACQLDVLGPLLRAWTRVFAPHTIALPPVPLRRGSDPLCARQLEAAHLWARVQMVNAGMVREKTELVANGVVDLHALAESAPLIQLPPGDQLIEGWVAVPRSQLRAVIGTRGRFIRPIQEEHGVIVLSPGFSQWTPLALLAVVGSRHSVHAACRSILARVHDAQVGDRFYQALRDRTNIQDA